MDNFGIHHCWISRRRSIHRIHDGYAVSIVKKREKKKKYIPLEKCSSHFKSYNLLHRPNHKQYNIYISMVLVHQKNFYFWDYFHFNGYTYNVSRYQIPFHCLSDHEKRKVSMQKGIPNRNRKLNLTACLSLKQRPNRSRRHKTSRETAKRI